MMDYRSRRVWPAGGTALAIILVALAGSAGHRETTALAAETTAGADGSGTVDQAVDFRRSFGLPSDRTYVERAADDPTDFPNLDWGIPLSADEAADLRRRMDIQGSLGAALKYGTAQGDWAGAFIDQQTQGLPIFFFTSDIGRHRSDIASLLPAEDNFAVEQAGYSLADLERFQATIDQASPDLSAKGVAVIRTSVDVAFNAVRVAVETATPAAVDAIRSLAPKVLVEEAQLPQGDSCDIRGCPPIKAGVAVTHDNIHICTDAYLGRRQDNNDVVMVTAGHCIMVNGGGGKEWTDYAGTDIGPASASYTWESMAGADVGFVKVLPANYPGTFNKILVRNTPLVAYINHAGASMGPEPEQVGGAQVCRFGYGSWLYLGHHTPRTCGQIVAVNVTNQDCVTGHGCIPVQHLVTVSFDSHQGDSGGPTFTPEDSNSRTTLYGIHIDSDPDPCDGPGCEGWYSPWDRAQQQLQTEYGIVIAPCITNGC